MEGTCRNALHVHIIVCLGRGSPCSCEPTTACTPCSPASLVPNSSPRSSDNKWRIAECLNELPLFGTALGTACLRRSLHVAGTLHTQGGTSYHPIPSHPISFHLLVCRDFMRRSMENVPCRYFALRRDGIIASPFIILFKIAWSRTVPELCTTAPQLAR